MILYILRRLLFLIPTILGVTLLTFVMIKLTPGDPVLMMLGPGASPEAVTDLRQRLGLDDPLWIQYLRYIGNVFQGDLGRSIRGQTPVAAEIMARFPSTLELTASALFLAIVLGVGAGLLSATVKSKWVQISIMSLALAGLSVPEFWLAIVLLIIFGVKLGWVPVIGGTGWTGLILPSICLALAPAAVLARLTRSSMLEVLNEDYVRTASSKGLAYRYVVVRHVLPNALIPVVTTIGLQFAGLLGGAVFIESVFSRPGLGRFAVNAIANRDLPQIQGVVLTAATVYVLVNLLVDVLYGVLNPRIRSQ